jgi:peptide/nickel transport system permease protein
VLQLIAQRLLTMIPMLGIVSAAVFSLTLLIPGDPARVMLGDQATPEAIAALHTELGLDDPLPVQYARWLDNVLHGNLGTSFINRSSVMDAVVARAPVTASLVVGSIVLSLAVALPLGLVAAYRRGSMLDRLLSAGASAGIAMPEFWFGAMLILFFALKLRVLPSGTFISLRDDPLGFVQHLILPVITVALPGTAELFRQTRAGASDVLSNAHIRTARASGVPVRSILFKHVAKNAMLPVVTVLGLQLGRLVGVAALAETIFGMQGIGFLAVSAALSSDMPTIQGIALLSTAIVMLANLLVDLSYFYFNPKARPS